MCIRDRYIAGQLGFPDLKLYLKTYEPNAGNIEDPYQEIYSLLTSDQFDTYNALLHLNKNKGETYLKMADLREKERLTPDSLNPETNYAMKGTGYKVPAFLNLMRGQFEGPYRTASPEEKNKQLKIWMDSYGIQGEDRDTVSHLLGEYLEADADTLSEDKQYLIKSLYPSCLLYTSRCV